MTLKNVLEITEFSRKRLLNFRNLKAMVDLHTEKCKIEYGKYYYSSFHKKLLKKNHKSGEILINNRIAWENLTSKRRRDYINYPERVMSNH